MRFCFLKIPVFGRRDMAVFALLYFIVLLQVFVHVVNGAELLLNNHCTTALFGKLKGKRLENHIILTLKMDTVTMCVSQCLIYSGCQSVNYNTLSKTCQLNNAESAATPPDLRSDTDHFTYLGRDVFFLGLGIANLSDQYLKKCSIGNCLTAPVDCSNIGQNLAGDYTSVDITFSGSEPHGQQAGSQLNYISDGDTNTCSQTYGADVVAWYLTFPSVKDVAVVGIFTDIPTTYRIYSYETGTEPTETQCTVWEQKNSRAEKAWLYLECAAPIKARWLYIQVDVDPDNRMSSLCEVVLFPPL